MEIENLLLLVQIFATYAYDELSASQNSIQSSTWVCSDDTCKWYAANNAVDGDIKTCMRTNFIGQSNTEKTVWWRVDLGDIKSIYSIRIQYKDYEDYTTRQRGRLAGFSLYISNTTEIQSGFLCYKDGPELPQLDFTKLCTIRGRFVTFYNERLTQENYPANYQTTNVVTELCEVNVMGCRKDGFYGINCDRTCPLYCKESVCNLKDGACFGCTAGWSGDFCNETCKFGYYGLDCKARCTGYCLGGASCNHISGECEHGFEAGWFNSNCNQSCNDGWYGPGCKYTCSGNCKNGLPCDKSRGKCESCATGYMGENCNDTCTLGFYGENCTKVCSSFCRISRHCNNVNGHCKNGCLDGYIGPKCDTSCNDGWYGNNCSQRCNENCINQTCEKDYGVCIFGCKPGWSTDNCSKECDIGFYGTNCTNRCLNCLNNACNAGNGICIQGCEDGYMGQRCEQTCITGRFGRNCSSVCNRNCRLKSCENTQGGCTNGCEPGWEGFNCSEEALNLKIADSRITDADKGVLAGSLATSIIFIGAVTITIIIIIRRRRNTKERYTANQQQGFEENEIDGFDNPVYITNSLEKTHSPRHNTLKIFELQAIIESMPVSENVSFKSEYEKIPKGELYPCTEWKKVENVPKNRFLSALPYDHSRVILKKSCPGESDYINANYVKDVQGQKAYIATQGPKPKTFTDFWRMVWQENVSIIVCLTNLKDGIKAKCALYWPNANSRIQNGYLSVQHRDEKVYANHIVRRFWIQNISNNSKRDVIMFHFTQWPVHGAPEPLSLVIFHRHVMKMSRIYRGKYTLVHCSNLGKCLQGKTNAANAGIGRTGTFIALDALYRQAEETGEIDVPHYLESMRKDRMNMIQGEDEYKTVYLALYESFRGRASSISSENFLEEFREQSCYVNLGNVANKSPLSAELEELLSIKRKYSEKEYELGRKTKEANLTQNVLTVDEYTCHTLSAKGASSYYNAVLLQSFTKDDCFISAQYPLPIHVEDFLNLVKDLNTLVIVSLFPMKEFPSSSIWFPKKREDKTVGEFTIKFSESTKMANIVKIRITLQSKKSSDVQVTVLKSTTWKGENNTSGRRMFIDLIKQAKKEEDTYPGGRILLLSSDGAKRCGQFCVVYNALEQMTMDGEVDIFTITRQLQIRRPEFINSLEDYQFCYDAVADYLQNDAVYSNC